MNCRNEMKMKKISFSFPFICYKMLTDCEMNFFASNKSLIVRKKHKQTSSVHTNWKMF